MTLIPDTPEANLLDAVVANDHLVLGGLLVELGRTPPTPGTVPQLTRDIDRHTRVHMAVVERLLLPILQEGASADAVAAANANHELVRGHLDDLTGGGRALDEALPELEASLADQFAFEDGVLLPAISSGSSDRELERLGFRYSELADSGVVSAPDATGGTEAG
jgi:hypothetical protein